MSKTQHVLRPLGDLGTASIGIAVMPGLLWIERKKAIAHMQMCLETA